MPILMRTGKTRSAAVIISLGFPGIPCSSFVLGKNASGISSCPALGRVGLVRYPSAGMTCWPVSVRVGNVKNNDPSLIEPIAVNTPDYIILDGSPRYFLILALVAAFSLKSWVTTYLGNMALMIL